MPQGIRFAPAEANLKRKEDRSVLDSGPQKFLQMIGDLLGMNDPEAMLPTPAAVVPMRGMSQTAGWLAEQVPSGKMPAAEGKKIMDFITGQGDDLNKALASVRELPADIGGSGRQRGRIVPRGTSDIEIKSGEGAANTFAHESKHALDHAVDPEMFNQSYGEWLNRVSPKGSGRPSNFGFYNDNPWEEGAVGFAEGFFPEPLERKFMRSLATSVERARTNPSGAIGAGLGAGEALRRKEAKPKK